MVVDFHSHILPQMDDGSSSVEESLSMLRCASEQGIREVILTPHFYPQYTTPRCFLEKRSRALTRLQEQIDPAKGLPTVRTGAEVYFFPQMSHCDEIGMLAIEGTDCVLIEMPMSHWTDRMYRELEDISINLGLTPIIAHVDRYLGRFRDHGIPQRLAELPVLVQANASFFLSGAKGINMLRNRQIHLLGSDSHNMTDRRPNLGPAVERIMRKLGPDAIAWINRNEREILRFNGDSEL